MRRALFSLALGVLVISAAGAKADELDA